MLLRRGFAPQTLAVPEALGGGLVDVLSRVYPVKGGR